MLNSEYLFSHKQQICNTFSRKFNNVQLVNYDDGEELTTSFTLTSWSGFQVIQQPELTASLPGRRREGATTIKVVSFPGHPSLISGTS